MVLCWRRHGRVGGCQIYGGVAQLGEHLPCKQGVKSSNLSISTRQIHLADLYLENRILKWKISNLGFILRLRIDIEDPELTMIERSKTHMEVITLYDTMLENRSYQTIMDVILHCLKEEFWSRCISSAHSSEWLSCVGRRADALALRAEERRDKLRKAAVRSTYP